MNPDDHSPEERADSLVRVMTNEPGGGWFVELGGLLPEPVRLCANLNPSLVQDDAKRIKAYLAALIQEERRRSRSLTVFHPE
jgi:hypothetical protein